MSITRQLTQEARAFLRKSKATGKGLQGGAAKAGEAAQLATKLRGDFLAVEAEKLGRNLHSFIRGMWQVVEPGRAFEDNWHIGAICEVLEAVSRFELNCVVINVPPRSTKSMSVCVAWPAWEWTKRPATRFLFTTHDEGLGTRDSVRTRRVLESQWYRERWDSSFRLTTDQNVKTNFENDKTGYRITETVGGSVMGKGGDHRVIDDPHKTDSQESDSVREAKLQWLREEFSTRYIDPRRNSLVIIMQRLHERDMSGFVLAERWADYHLCIPMRYEQQRRIYVPPTVH